MQANVDVTDNEDCQEAHVSLADKLIYQYFVWKEKEFFLKELGQNNAAHGVSLCLSNVSSLLVEEGIDFDIVEMGDKYECQHMYKDRLYILAQNIVTDKETVAFISGSMNLSESYLRETYYGKVQSTILENRKLDRELLEVTYAGLSHEPFVAKIKRLSSVLSPMGLQTSGSYNLDEMKEILHKALI